MLRLIELREARVTDKKMQPTAASLKNLEKVLLGSDFYLTEDAEEEDWGPASDLSIKTFAWPMLLQAADLVQKAGDRLELTAAGRKALPRPSEEVIRAIWKKWQNTTVVDEFSRVAAIRGQGKGKLSALAGRRKAVREALADCPTNEWFAVDSFFRFMRATDRYFVAHNPFGLYISEHHYGHLGDFGSYHWEQLQGRFILAFLFEYAATLGLIDVAYLPPQGERDDFSGRWGTDDLSCLSRYDGLKYVRINALGAWCLGLAERFEMLPLAVKEVLQALPNLEVVIKTPPVAPVDRLVLDRYAEQVSDLVWKLSKDRILGFLEQGGTLTDLEQFSSMRGIGGLPHTVEVFLSDLKQRGGELRDLGSARLVEWRNPGIGPDAGG